MIKQLAKPRWGDCPLKGGLGTGSFSGRNLSPCTSPGFIKRILFILSFSLGFVLLSFPGGAGAYITIVSLHPFPSLEFSRAGCLQEKLSPGDFLKGNLPSFSKIAYALEREAQGIRQIGRSA